MSYMPQKTADASNPLRVLVVDDHALLTEMMVSALGRDGTFEIQAVSSVEDGLEKLRSEGPYDVILADYEGPGMEGLDGLQRLLEASGGKVALFSGAANWTVVERAIDAGARGFLPKTLPLRTVGHAIRFIADGELYLPGEYMLRKANQKTDDLGLKPREQKVLALLSEGMQNKEIAQAMDAEETTVKLDVKSVCHKLGVRNRTQAVIKAMKMGIV